MLIPSSGAQLKKANLQEIKLFDPIISADAILKEILVAQKDKNIKDVLLNVDSRVQAQGDPSRSQGEKE